ncbi:MAG TPA: hypothetical protein VMZ71_05900, partial [Gemmataceae bacterium]|nr:hypothetical protein [Gemmataceae bacterium]
LLRFALEVDPGVVVPFLLLTPNGANGKSPAVLLVAQHGKSAFLKQRGDAIAAFLKAGVAVCLIDVRGTGETKAGDPAGRTSSRTSVSQTNLILGTPLIGAQLRDLRTVVRWLQKRDDIDGQKLAVWGDSFAPPNADGVSGKVPHDAPNPPTVGEPGAALLAQLAALFEPGVRACYTRGGLKGFDSICTSPYPLVPHDAIVPGAATVAVGVVLPGGVSRKDESPIDGENKASGPAAVSPTDAVAWVLKALK